MTQNGPQATDCAPYFERYVALVPSGARPIRRRLACERRRSSLRGTNATSRGAAGAAYCGDAESLAIRHRAAGNFGLFSSACPARGTGRALP